MAPDVLTDLAVDRRGDHGEPILLVMGLGLPGEMWDPIATRLAPRHQVATFDHRGTGRSPGPPRRTMATLLVDALAVLDALGWASAHVVGVSMGGMVAQHLAIEHPLRVRTLTLIATLPGGPFAALPAWEGLRALLIRDPVARAAALLHPAALRDVERARVERVAALLAAHPETRRAHLCAVARHDARAGLASIRAPTLVVQPGRDVLVRPSHAERLARAIPGARLARRPDVGHGCIGHDADALAELILAQVEAR